MKKTELVQLKLLLEGTTTQASLAKTLGISLSTVNAAIAPLRRMGAVVVSARGLRVIDTEKILLLLATQRDFAKDTVYSTRVDGMTVSAIEKSMPQGVMFTAYSAYKFRYEDVPADYSEVYVYTNTDKTLGEIEKRFPKRKGRAQNLFVLRLESRIKELSKSAEIVPDPLVFADLWNIREWYARDFLNALWGRILSDSERNVFLNIHKPKD